MGAWGSLSAGSTGRPSPVKTAPLGEGVGSVSGNWMGSHCRTGRAGLSLGSLGLCGEGGGVLIIRAMGCGFMYTRVTCKGLDRCPFQLGQCLWVFSEWDSVLRALSQVPVSVPLRKGVLLS